VLHINSTAFGGGVAELLQTQLGLLRDLGIDAVWQLLRGNDDFFTVTKTVHNGMQGADVTWTEAMQHTYSDCLLDNANELVESADFSFIHDPQPCALLSVLEQRGKRSGKWLWRCHIDTSTPNRAVWDFYVPFVNRYDAAIFTMERYRGPGIEGPMLAYITPTIDPLSMKNTYFDPATTSSVLRHYGVDRHRPILLQVSRFDPWKDPLGVIDAYRLVKKNYPDVQLVMVGSMAHDDPEGWGFLTSTREHAGSDTDIHLLTNLDQVGNLEVNAFQRSATVVLQKSIREGFGLTVSEAMWKKKPVVGGDVGGIALQIVDGETGFLVDTVEGCAARISQLLGDPALRYSMGRAGKGRVRDRFLTLRELEDYLLLMASL
jgi:trehalose synthase